MQVLAFKNRNKKGRVPWEIEQEEKNYVKEPYILNKGQDFITIEKNISEKGEFYIQKNEEKRLSIKQSQAQSTFYKLKNIGYKLRKKRKN